MRLLLRFSIIDFIVIVFITLVVISWAYQSDSYGNLSLARYIQFVFLYCIARVLYSFFSHTKSLFIISIILLCILESVIGISQYVRYLRSDFILFSCNGTFNNPGPYGGFLALCISILIPYVLFGENTIIKRLSVISIILALLVLPSTLSRASFLSVGCSLLLLAFKSEKIYCFVRRHWLFAVLSILICSLSAYYIKKPSADGRFLMNKISLMMMKQNFITGVGMGNFASEYGKNQAEYFSIIMKDNGDDIAWNNLNERERMVADCPRKAFNEYLQIGVENGFFSMISFVLLIIISILFSYKDNQMEISCGLLCLSIFAFFSYPYDFLLFIIVLSFLVAGCSSHQKMSKLNCALLSFLLIGSVFIAPSIIDSIKREKNFTLQSFETKKWYDNGRYDYIVQDNCLVDYKEINNVEFLFIYGKALSETGDYIKSDSVLLQGTRLSSDPMFWIVMGNNSLSMKKYREAEERYKYAFYMVPNRMYPLYKLAYLYYVEGNYHMFSEMLEKIDSFVPKVESEKTESMKNELFQLKQTL